LGGRIRPNQADKIRMRGVSVKVEMYPRLRRTDVVKRRGEQKRKRSHCPRLRHDHERFEMPIGWLR
jgi:hypothetical protein